MICAKWDVLCLREAQWYLCCALHMQWKLFSASCMDNDWIGHCICSMKCVVPEIGTRICVLSIMYATKFDSAFSMHNDCCAHDICKWNELCLRWAQWYLCCALYTQWGLFPDQVCTTIVLRIIYIWKIKGIVLEIGTIILVLCSMYAMRLVPTLGMHIDRSCMIHENEMCCAGNRHEDISVVHWISNGICSRIRYAHWLYCAWYVQNVIGLCLRYARCFRFAVCCICRGTCVAY